jgi:hypothetical protein
MPSSDKAAVKVGMADEIIDSLDDTIANAERNVVALTASTATAKRIAEQFVGYRQRIERARNPEEGDDPADAMTEAEYQAALLVYRALFGIVHTVERGAAKTRSEQGPFIAGIRRARAIAESKRDAEQRKGERADREAQADEDDSAGQAAGQPRQGNGNTPRGAPAGTTAPRNDDPDPEPPADLATPHSGDSGDDSDTDDDPLCAHCNDPITMPTGEERCSACMSHRNRYGKLPSEKALANRRARNGNT